jgi:hypothetical protein
MGTATAGHNTIQHNRTRLGRGSASAVLINKVIARSFSDAAIFILKSYCRKRKIATGYAPYGALYDALAMTLCIYKRYIHIDH